MLSSLFSQSTIEAQPFRPYEDQWHGKDFSAGPYNTRFGFAWSDSRDQNDDLPSLTESVSGLFSRVRSSFSRA